MAPVMKLTYIDLPARAEPTRLALAVAGVQFDDVRVELDVLYNLKACRETPFASLPVLEVDGEVYAESSALLRYAGKLGGLYPKCDKAAMKVDMVVDAVEVPLDRAIGAVYSKDTKAAREIVIKEVVPRYLGAIEKMYASKKGAYLLGEQLTIADLKVAVVFKSLSDGGLLAVAPLSAFEAYPLIQAATKAVYNEAKVMEWYKKKAN